MSDTPRPLGTASPQVTGRWTLRDLPFSARITLAVFLVSVGVGYFSALVNLHFQSARPGEPLPTGDDAVLSYHRKKGVSHFVHLLEAHPSLPFNGQGSMRAAFGSKAGGLDKARRTKAKELKLDLEKPEGRQGATEAVFRDMEGERRAVVAWANMEDGDKQKAAYEEDRFPLLGELGKAPITSRFVEAEGQPYAKVKSIIESRCARCHSESVGGAGSHYPLDKYEDIEIYLHTDRPSGKSLSKLALTTHVHLLGFSMLYGLTGVIFALSACPGVLRLIIAPLPLLAQVVDISFWWLARLEGEQGEMFARAIPVSGSIVAVGLGLQIFLTLFTLFGRWGKLALILLIVAAGLGGYVAKERVIDPYLAKEREGIVKPD